jgi:hypothetical protein
MNAVTGSTWIGVAASRSDCPLWSARAPLFLKDTIGTDRAAPSEEWKHSNTSPRGPPLTLSKPSGMSASDSREHLGAGGAAFGWRRDLG